MNKPTIGVLGGDFPWETPPRRLGKLLSWGAVARNVTRALSMVGTVIPCVAPARATSPAEQRATLAAFLRSIDLLWADFYPGTALALHLRHELNIPCRAVLFAGGTLPKGAEAMLFPWQHLLRPDDALLFSCRADQEICRRLVAWSTLPEWVVPCPVDESVFHPDVCGNRAAVRRAFGLPSAVPLLLFVGRLNIQKNLHSLLRLLAAVRREVPDAHLCLVGEEDDIQLAEFGVRNTDYVAWLRSLALELGVAGAVTFPGPLFGEELANRYRAADVVVNLSVYHRENFGLSQAEAQACGVPVVCADWGGFKDVVRHGETGYLVDAVLTKHGVRVDWATAAQHVVRMLQDPDLRATMGARAAAWAQQRFAIAAVAPHLGAVVSGKRSAPDRAGPTVDGGLVYKPSGFAHRYEEHKRACGWYADTGAVGAVPAQGPWYPRMFEGWDYALYETLMQPYATRLAVHVPPDTLDLSWIPYTPSGVDLDPIRHIARDLDPIWPHQRYLQPIEWEVLRRVDGATAVRDIVDGLVGRHAGDAPIITALWRLHVEGFVLFSRPWSGPYDLKGTLNERS